MRLLQRSDIALKRNVLYTLFLPMSSPLLTLISPQSSNLARAVVLLLGKLCSGCGRLPLRRPLHENLTRYDEDSRDTIALEASRATAYKRSRQYT